MNDMATRKKKNSKSFGVVFWVALLALAAIIFISNRDNIDTAIKKSNIREFLSGRTSDTPAPQDTRDDANEVPTSAQKVDENDHSDRIEEALRRLELVELGTPAAVPAPPPTISPAPEEQRAEDAQSTEKAPPEQRNDDAPTTQATRFVYFIDVDDSGRIVPIRVARTTDWSPRPMSQSIQLLLAGLVEQEVATGLLHLVPEGSQLISAYIDDTVAYLNFNDQFRYNPLGAEGIVAQLAQVVYSVTEFPTVERVQILINGEKIDYLNSESAIYLQEPIGRDLLG